MEIKDFLEDEQNDETEEGKDNEPLVAESDTQEQEGNLTSKSPLLKKETSELEDAEAVHDDLEDNMAELIVSKKGLLGLRKDSSQMEAMRDGLIGLIDIFYQKMPRDAVSLDRGVGEVLERYQRAIQGTETYIEYIEGKKKGAYFGKKRINLARAVQKQLVTERRLFSASARSLIENSDETESFRWRDALRETRGTKINLHGNNVEIIGAGASRIYKVTDDNGKETYIKPEERVAKGMKDHQAMVSMFRNTSPEAAAFLNEIEDLVISNAQEDDDTQATTESGEKELVVNALSNIAIQDLGSFSFTIDPKDSKGNPRSKDDMEAERFAKTVGKVRGFLKGDRFGEIIWNAFEGNFEKQRMLCDLATFLIKKVTEASSAVGTAEIAGGSTISDRNVSSYRLAKRLGQADLIAKSETMVIEDDFGRTVRANAMEGVSGMEFAQANKYAKEVNKKLTFTPESLEKYNQLCIMDMISGQADRHQSNFMVTTHEDDEFVYIDSLKGIDNDAAFGTLDMSMIEAGRMEKLDAIYATYAKGWGKEEVQTIKYISEDFYNSIMEYDDATVEYDQMDLRTKQEIEALKARLARVKQTLKILFNAGMLKLTKNDEDRRAAYGETRDYFGSLAAGSKTAFKALSAKGQLAVAAVR